MDHVLSPFGRRSSGGNWRIVAGVARYERSVPLQRGFYEPSSGASPGVMRLEDCESLYTHLENEEAITEKCLARYISWGNEYWLPGV